MNRNNRYYKIELSIGEKILGYLFFIPCLILLPYLIYIAFEMTPMSFNTIIALSILVGADILSILYMSDFLTARIKVTPDNIFIRCGLVLHRNIQLKEIKLIYKVSQEEFIPRGNPAFSKNVVAIEYGTNKKIFISLKDRDEFISAIKTRIDHGQA